VGHALSFFKSLLHEHGSFNVKLNKTRYILLMYLVVSPDNAEERSPNPVLKHCCDMLVASQDQVCWARKWHCKLLLQRIAAGEIMIP
jgi:hypothetical protein